MVSIIKHGKITLKRRRIKMSIFLRAGKPCSSTFAESQADLAPNRGIADTTTILTDLVSRAKTEHCFNAIQSSACNQSYLNDRTVTAAGDAALFAIQQFGIAS